MRHTRTPPYQLTSNESPERCVQTPKLDLQRQLLDERTGIKKTVQHCVDLCLFWYRNTPSPTTGQTPAELFLSWTFLTCLGLLQPNLGEHIEDGFYKAKSTATEKEGHRDRSPWVAVAWCSVFTSMIKKDFLLSRTLVLCLCLYSSCGTGQ